MIQCRWWKVRQSKAWCADSLSVLEDVVEAEGDVSGSFTLALFHLRSAVSFLETVLEEEEVE